MHPLSAELEHFLRNELGEAGQVALHEPCFAGNEWKYVKDCLDTGWVSSVGAYVDRFERDFAVTVGAKHAVVTINGTAALHIALYAVGVKPGDLVICPTLTFVATANSISHCHATPVFIDSELETLGMSVEALAAFLKQTTPSPEGPLWNGRRVAACVPVHIFGHAARMDEILALCASHGVPVVEDSTEGLGASAGGRSLGTFGVCGVFSFNGNKTITTGGGGMVVTDDDTLARRLKHLTTTARVKDRWNFVHDEIGWNYRLPNINAAIGCAQLEQLDGFLVQKRALANRYRARFAGLADAFFFTERAGTVSNYWLNAFLLPGIAERDRVLEETHAAGIDTRPCWTLMHRLAPYREAPRGSTLSGAEEIADRLVNVPSSAKLGRGFLNSAPAA